MTEKCHLSMPWNYRIDEERRLVITTLWDKATGAEVADHQRKLSNDPRFERDFFQFVDLADVAEIQIATTASSRFMVISCQRFLTRQTASTVS